MRSLSATTNTVGWRSSRCKFSKNSATAALSVFSIYGRLETQGMIHLRVSLRHDVDQGIEVLVLRSTCSTS